MKRLLLVYLYCNLGGVTSVWKQRMPALRSAGWSVDAIFKADHGGGSDLRNAGVGKILIADRKLVKATTQELRATSYDAVTIVDIPELIRPVRDSFHRKLIYEIHTSLSRVLRENSVQGLSDCDSVLVPSAWSKRWVLAQFPDLDPDLVHICPNIVSDREFFRDHDGRPTVTPSELLWVGKLEPLKNWREAARIAGLVSRRDIRFTMVTGGLVDYARAQELLAEWMADGVVDRSLWLHNLPLRAMADLYRRAARSGGALLSTSLSESFCLVAHEALRCGLPVVATRVGACPEIVRHEVSGFLYDPGDDTMAASRVDRLLTEPGLRENLADRAGAVLADFDGAKLATKYLGLLEGPYGSFCRAHQLGTRQRAAS